ncbi:MAG: polysaccharide biosynthesis tyrosine autokinase, partial [bacterium]
ILPAVVVPLTVILSCLFADSLYRADGMLRMRDSEEMFAWKDQGMRLTTELKIIESKAVLDDVREKMRTNDAFETFRNGRYFEEDVKNFDKSVHAQKLGREVNIIEVSVDNRSPELAAALTNALMDTVIDYNLQYKRREAHQTRSYIENQQEVVGAKLREAEDALREFQVGNKQADMKMYVETPYGDALTVVDPLAKVESELMPLREKVASLSKLYTNDHPELRQAKAGLAVREGYRKRMMQNITALPEKKTEYVRYLRDSEIYRKDYENLALAAQQAHLKEVGVVSDFSVIDRARPPTFAIYPKTLLSTITGALVGVMLGIFMAFFFDYLDVSIKDAEGVERALSVPLLGEIPYINLQTVKDQVLRRARAKGAVDGVLSDEAVQISERLVSHLAPKAVATEAYRQLYINLGYAQPDRKLKTLVVSSAGLGEGKSSIAANLGIVGASLGKRILLLDCDLRKPVMHKIFNLEQEPGLSTILTENAGWKGVVRSTGISSLDVVTAGNLPVAPMLLFNSVRFQALLDELCAQYDMILIDSPPINGIADTLILASKVDGTLVIVGQGRTDGDAATHAGQLLKNVNARVIGAVMNGLSEGRGYAYSSYHRYGSAYGYHGYYGHEEHHSEAKSVLARLAKVAARNGVLREIGRRAGLVWSDR